MNIFGNDPAVGRLEDRLGELEAAVRTLKTANKHLELEWEELYDKVRRQMSRMSKRSAIDAPTLPEIPEVEEEVEGVDPISKAILARRGGPRSVA